MWLYEVPESNDEKVEQANAFHFSDAENNANPDLHAREQQQSFANEQPLKKTSKQEILAKKRALTPAMNCLSYFVGLAASGVLFSLCSTEQKQILLHYGESWYTYFSGESLHLFSTLFLSSILLLTLLLVVGFCTFGKALSRVLLFLYGIGSGMLCLQMLLLYGWHGWLFYGLIPGLYSAVLALFMGRFSCFSAQLSTMLRKLLTQKENPPVYGVTAKALVEKYLVLCSLQIVCCSFFACVAKPVANYLL